MKWLRAAFRVGCAGLGLILVGGAGMVLQVASVHSVDDSEGALLVTAGILLLVLGIGFLLVAWRARLMV